MATRVFGDVPEPMKKRFKTIKKLFVKDSAGEGKLYR